MGILFLGTTYYSQAATNLWISLSPFYMSENVEVTRPVFFIDKDGDFIHDYNETFINTGELLGWNFGGRAELGFEVSSSLGLMFGYTGSFGQAETQYEPTSGLIEPLFGWHPGGSGGFWNTDLPDFEEAEALIMTYDTQLHAFDISLFWYLIRKTTCIIRARMGPKFFWIKDAMYFDSYDDGFADLNDRCDLHVDMNNWLYGAQAGLDFFFEVIPGVAFDANLSGGMYALTGDRELAFREYDDDEDTWTINNSYSTFGFFGDIIGGLLIQFSQPVSLRIGYSLIYLTRVGRSLFQIHPGMGLEEEFEPDDTPPNVSFIGDTFFHGATITLVFHF